MPSENFLLVSFKQPKFLVAQLTLQTIFSKYGKDCSCQTYNLGWTVAVNLEIRDGPWLLTLESGMDRGC
jgi:hypothetical protein